MVGLEIRLLGPFQVKLGDDTLSGFESNKVRALLAYLAVENGYAHSREVVSDLFWPEMPPKRASSNLSQALYNLRQLFGDQGGEGASLPRSRVQVGFNPEAAFWLDVHEFTALLDGYHDRDSTQAVPDQAQVERLQAAVALYRGDFLEGLAFDSSMAFDEWVLVMRRRLQRRILYALDTLAETYTRLNQIPEALSCAQRRVALDPLDEAGNRQLMRLLADNGQRSQALTQFERLRVLLAEELKVEPEPETLKIYDQIRTGTGSATRETLRWDNLPAFISPLVGRRSELAFVLEHLESPDCRLLTILGPGGSGKTHLALEAAVNSRPSYKNGILFVALNPLDSTQSITPAILEALALPRLEKQDPGTQLGNFLRDKNMLLVLDGFERLLTAANLVSDLLRASPGLKILVTSRARLNLKSEHLYRLPGMHYPHLSAPAEEILDSDAVQLLLSGLRRGGQGYQPEPEALEYLHRICAQVQGMPLGILLAASWGETFSLEEISARVSRTLDFLSADWADVPARQRSLRATCDHTWDLLGERERGIFRLLSVFREAFTRQAARQVCGANPHDLRELVDHSLLENSTPGWYQVHELLRQYGHERLAEDPRNEKRVKDKHSRYYLEQLARLGERLQSPDQEAALGSIELELENYTTAWYWAADQGAVDLLTSALETLCLYYDLRKRYLEGENACRLGVEGLLDGTRSTEQILLLAHLLTWGSRFTHLNGDLGNATLLFGKAQKYLADAQALLEFRNTVDGSKKDSIDPDLKLALTRLDAILNFELGERTYGQDRSAAASHYQQSLTCFRALNQTWWQARVVLQLVYCSLQQGDFNTTEAWLNTLFREMSDHIDPKNLARALNRKGFLQVRRGEYDQALDTIMEASNIFQALGDPYAVAEGYDSLGTLLGWHGRFPETIETLGKALRIYQDLGIRPETVYLCLLIGMAYALMGKGSQAESWAQKTISLAREFRLQRSEAAALMTRGWVALDQCAYGQALEFLRESVALYRQVNHRDELGWALAALGHAQIRLGYLKAGLANIQESLKTGIEIQAPMSIHFALGPSAGWVGEQGDPLRAVELYTLSRTNPMLGNSKWFENLYWRPIKALAADLPAEILQAAEERGCGMDLWKTADELLGELVLE